MINNAVCRCGQHLAPLLQLTLTWGAQFKATKWRMAKLKVPIQCIMCVEQFADRRFKRGRLHVPTAILVHSSVVPQLGSIGAVCSHSCIVHYVPTTVCFHSCKVPQLYVPTALYSQSSMFRKLYSPTVLCSHSCIIPQHCFPTAVK